MTFSLVACPLAVGAAPSGCDWCGVRLTGRRRRWCSRRCEVEYQTNHVWRYARPVALGRAGGRCTRCGATDALEVNHRLPLLGKPRTQSCHHHQTNLEVLCHDCHVEATAAQRAAGWFRTDGVAHSTDA